MREVYIIDGVRTPIAKAGKSSWFSNVRADDLGAECLKALVKRADIEPSQIDDVVWGTTSNATGEQGSNLGKMTTFMAGFPDTVPGCTVDRLCGTGLQSIQFAVSSIMSGWGDCMIAGGAQHMTHVPMGTGSDRNPRLSDFMNTDALNMGYTAEMVARKYNVTRHAQDEFAVESHLKAHSATQSGKFKNEIVPINGSVLQEDGSTILSLISKDQGIRADSSVAGLAKLKPIFMQDDAATVTAGNSSQINDAAAAVLIMSKDKMLELGCKPRLKMQSFAVVSMDPNYMGLSPVYAIPKALKRANLTIADIDVWEINEAFASQSIVVRDNLNIPKEKVNIWGSGISLGHPLGATGARLTTTLMNVMDDRDARYGVVSMCIGHGQGAAAVFKRV